MVQKIKDILKSWSEVGIKFPFAWDASTNKPSVTLLSFYVMMILTTLSLIILHLKTDLWLATGFTLIAFTLSFVFYKMRQVDKLTLDLKNQSVELDANDDEEDKKDGS